MYSSPATPAGTGSSHPSSTNSRVFATGDPIGGGPPAASAPSSRAVATPMVASVGP